MGARTQPAAEEALNLPEILENIFRHVFDDDFFQEEEVDDDAWMEMIPGYQRPEPEEDATSNTSDERKLERDEEEPPYTLSESYGNYGVLVRCALVSTLWAETALPILWEDYRSWMASEMNIAYRFETIEPSRRQYYANMIKTLAMYTTREDTQDKLRISTDGITFPNVPVMTLFVTGSGAEVPDIKVPNLVTLNIDPHYEDPPCEVYVFQDDWKKVLDAIPVSSIMCGINLFSNESVKELYPSLKEVNFEDVAYIPEERLEKFKSALPNLKKCDSASVRPPHEGQH